MFLSLFCPIKQFCFPFPLLGVADFTLVERALNSSALLFWNTAFCGAISFIYNYHLCNFWFCFYGRQNNKTYVMFFFWLSMTTTNRHSEAVLTALSYPVFWEDISSGRLSTRMQHGRAFLNCFVALHYIWHCIDSQRVAFQTSGQINLLPLPSFKKRKQL